MSTQQTDYDAVQFLYDTCAAIMYPKGAATCQAHDFERAIDRFYMPESSKRLSYSSDKLFYIVRALQVFNCRAVNVRYSHLPNMLTGLNPIFKLKENNRKAYSHSVTRKEVLQAIKILRHLDYNLDDYSAKGGCMAHAVELLHNALTNYYISTSPEYDGLGWGEVKL